MICPRGECPRNVAAAASWQRISSFLATDSNFLGQTQHSCGSTGSLLSRQAPYSPDRIPTLPTGSLLSRQSSYSPDMALCDFFLFPHLKTQLKGTRFVSWDDIIWNTMAKLYSIRKEAFQKCFEKWQNRWEKRVQSQGDYFEGDWGCRPPGM